MIDQPTTMKLRAPLMTLAAASTVMVLLPVPESAGQHREVDVGRICLYWAAS